MNKCGNWVRVNWENRCPVCGKGDWCLVSQDGSAAICPRTESPRDLGEAGFLHVLVKRENWTPPAAPKDRRVEDMTELAEKYRRAISPGGLEEIAKRFGVSVDAVKAFGVGWSSHHQAWTIPSRNTLVGNWITGIQLRKTDGSKFAVSGSKFGLYMPIKDQVESLLLIVEGASDSIAAYHSGFRFVCGRHNCAGGEGYVVAHAIEFEPERVVICADNDKPNQWGRRVGLDGAEKLAKVLKYHVKDVRVVAPPEGFKDFREWVCSGITRPQIEEEWRL